MVREYPRGEDPWSQNYRNGYTIGYGGKEWGFADILKRVFMNVSEPGSMSRGGFESLRYGGYISGVHDGKADREDGKVDASIHLKFQMST